MDIEDKYNGAVDTALRPSRWAGGFVVAATLATVALSCLMPIDAGPRALLGLSSLALGIRAARTHVLQQGPQAARRLRLDSTGAVEVEDGDGRWRSGATRPGCVVTPWVSVLRWRPEGARRDRVLLLVADMMEREALRRIRVILRWS